MQKIFGCKIISRVEWDRKKVRRMQAAAIEEDEGKKNYERKFVNIGRGLKSAEI